jgi:hypothetical protein
MQPGRKPAGNKPLLMPFTPIHSLPHIHNHTGVVHHCCPRPMNQYYYGAVVALSPYSPYLTPVCIIYPDAPAQKGLSGQANPFCMGHPFFGFSFSCFISLTFHGDGLPVTVGAHTAPLHGVKQLLTDGIYNNIGRGIA